MYIAAQEGQDEALSVLIDAKADVNTATNVSYLAIWCHKELLNSTCTVYMYMYVNYTHLTMISQACGIFTIYFSVIQFMYTSMMYWNYM